jgi:hypothetical protein
MTKEAPKDIPNTNKAEAAQETTFAKEKITDAEVKVATETLVGDLRDYILDQFKNRQKPWQQMSESEQRDTAEQIQKNAKDVVAKVVKLIAENGRKTIVAHLHDFKVYKGVITAKITTKKTADTLLEFSESQQKTVLVIASDSAEFEGERAPVAIDPDQGDLEKNIAAKASGAKTKKLNPASGNEE